MNDPLLSGQYRDIVNKKLIDLCAGDSLAADGKQMRYVETTSHATINVGTNLYGGSGGKVWKLDIDGNVTTLDIETSTIGAVTYIESTGYLYFVGSSGVTKVSTDLTEYELIYSNSIGTYPGISTDGEYLYVISSVASSYLYKIDPSTGSVILSRALSTKNGHWISYDGTHLFATSTSGKVFKILPSDISIITSTTISGTPTDDNAILGDYIYIGLETIGQIKVLNKSDLTTYTNITASMSYCVVTDGTYIYSGCKSTGNIEIIDPSTNSLVKVVAANDGGSPNEIVFANNNMYWTCWNGTRYHHISYMNKDAFLRQGSSVTPGYVDFSSAQYLYLPSNVYSDFFTIESGYLTLKYSIAAPAIEADYTTVYSTLVFGVNEEFPELEKSIVTQDVSGTVGVDLIISAGNAVNDGTETVVGGDLYLDGGGAYEGAITTNGNVLMATVNCGNVGINTSTPTEKLTVVGNIAVTGTVDNVDISALPNHILCTASTLSVVSSYSNRPIVLAKPDGNQMIYLPSATVGMVVYLLRKKISGDYYTIVTPQTGETIEIRGEVYAASQSVKHSTLYPLAVRFICEEAGKWVGIDIGI